MFHISCLAPTPLRRAITSLAAATVLIAGCTAPGETTTTEGESPQHMVAAANPLAAEAGMRMLRQGGSAVDAAIATALVLGLVEPQSSGIGGGAFLMHHQADNRSVTAYDGRESAPSEAGEDLFLKADGEPMAFWDAVVGGRSVGTPGLLRMLELAHQDHGRLPWADLFAPAIELAEQGFAVSPRLHGLIAGDKYLKRYDETAAYFHDAAGEALAVGTLRKNQAYADTLRAVAENGADAFYTGQIAVNIVNQVRAASGNPGLLSYSDMTGYQAKRRKPVCAPYRQWQVCGMPPPTSGGVAVLQILSLLEPFDLPAMGAASPEAIHLVAEAGRLAFADRNRFLADSDFVEVPVEALLDPQYLGERAKQISPAGSLGKAEPGLRMQQAHSPQQLNPPSTSHLSVVDKDGNAVSMTASIESAFGSRVMAEGFLLNNELTDFSFRPSVDGLPVANRVQAGKRPRSSMSPTLVLDRQGRFVMAIGSPGGSRIIGYTTKAIVGALDWNLSMQDAIDLPNFVNRNGATDLEEGRGLEAAKTALEALGHEVNLRDLTSGLHGIRLTGDGLDGGADPRREGVVLTQ
ncbi:gamma-glutamyltransferase [Pelagibius litoralis]|uniref:Glutathione hydrolase proenzyme n=1 Tax=Pelagibius litoralis TaxID=374515 RepID=A0A967F1C7_9PROT|nr:gamma-glutamyltransferase [Pelagibius litoralis]NIA71270.1 gamma-glutamyltransferase [Pelagibius litoralis]